MRRGGEGDKLDGTKLEAKGRNRRGEEVRGERARRGGGLFRRLCRGGGLTLMISQYLCQRDLSQQVEGNMSASEAAIREYPAATHAACLASDPRCLSRHTHTHGSTSTQEKAPLYQVITNHPSLTHAVFICYN